MLDMVRPLTAPGSIGNCAGPEFSRTGATSRKQRRQVRASTSQQPWRAVCCDGAGRLSRTAPTFCRRRCGTRAPTRQRLAPEPRRSEVPKRAERVGCAAGCACAGPRTSLSLREAVRVREAACIQAGPGSVALPRGCACTERLRLQGRARSGVERRLTGRGVGARGRHPRSPHDRGVCRPGAAPAPAPHASRPEPDTSPHPPPPTLPPVLTGHVSSVLSGHVSSLDETCPDTDGSPQSRSTVCWRTGRPVRWRSGRRWPSRSASALAARRLGSQAASMGSSRGAPPACARSPARAPAGMHAHGCPRPPRAGPQCWSTSASCMGLTPQGQPRYCQSSSM